MRASDLSERKKHHDRTNGVCDAANRHALVVGTSVGGLLTGRVDAVLVGDHLPELGTDLVTALASLDVDEFALRAQTESQTTSANAGRKDERAKSAGASKRRANEGQAEVHVCVRGVWAVWRGLTIFCVWFVDEFLFKHG